MRRSRAPQWSGSEINAPTARPGNGDGDPSTRGAAAPLAQGRLHGYGGGPNPYSLAPNPFFSC